MIICSYLSREVADYRGKNITISPTFVGAQSLEEQRLPVVVPSKRVQCKTGYSREISSKRTPRKECIVIDEAARERLACFRESIIVPLTNTDADKWPIRSGRISRLCLDEFSSEFFADIDCLREQHVPESSIAGLFRTPTHLWRMSHHLLNGLRLLSVSLEVQQQAILTVLGMIEHLKYGDLFCSSGANIILSPVQVTDAVDELQPIQDLCEARLIHQLAGVLWAYAESLYFVAHELALEIHGPYQLSGGCLLLVRDFFDLHPYHLWPSIDSLVSHQSVRIMVVYKYLDIHVDVYNNLYIDPGKRLLNEACSYQVLIDGHAANLSQVEQLILTTGRAIEAISHKVNAWALEEIVRQYIHIFWWRKAALSQSLQRNWRPPEKVLRRVVSKNIPDATSANPPLEALRRQYDLL